MSYYWHKPCDDCNGYVQAELCAGEVSPGYNVYVHEVDLPETIAYFLYEEHCYSIDPDGEQGALSEGNHRVTPVYDYEGCTACIERENDDGESDGGAPDPGGDPYDPGWHIGWGGDWYWGWESGAASGYDEWYKATACSGHEIKGGIYMPAEKVNTTLVFRFQDVCYVVSPGTIYPEVPEDGLAFAARSMFESCDECTNGIQATLCPEQADPENADDVWLATAQEGGAEIRYFMHNGYCYVFDPGAMGALIPENATIFTVGAAEFEDCDACGNGIQATLCADQEPPDYDVWIAEANVPAAFQTFRYEGYCYTIEPEDDLGIIPADAKVAVPLYSGGFSSCESCLCNATFDQHLGSRAIVCSGQDMSDVPEYWVRASDIPRASTVWREGGLTGVCLSANLSMPLQPIPPDATIVFPKQRYHNCAECVEEWNIGGTGGGGGGFPPPIPPGEDPNGGDDDDEGIRYYAREILECGGAGTGVYVFGPWYPAGFVFQANETYWRVKEGKCYKISDVLTPNIDLLPGSLKTNLAKKPLASCGDCSEELVEFKLTDCEQNWEGEYDFLYTDSEHTNMDRSWLNKVIRYQGRCWTVTEESGVGTDIMIFGTKHTTCGTCKSDPQYYILNACDSSGWKVTSSKDSNITENDVGRVVRVAQVCYFVSKTDDPTGCVSLWVSSRWHDCNACPKTPCYDCGFCEFGETSGVHIQYQSCTSTWGSLFSPADDCGGGEGPEYRAGMWCVADLFPTASPGVWASDSVTIHYDPYPLPPYDQMCPDYRETATVSATVRFDCVTQEWTIAFGSLPQGAGGIDPGPMSNGIWSCLGAEKHRKECIQISGVPWQYDWVEVHCKITATEACGELGPGIPGEEIPKIPTIPETPGP